MTSAELQLRGCRFLSGISPRKILTGLRLNGSVIVNMINLLIAEMRIKEKRPISFQVSFPVTDIDRFSSVIGDVASYPWKHRTYNIFRCGETTVRVLIIHTVTTHWAGVGD